VCVCVCVERQTEAIRRVRDEGTETGSRPRFCFLLHIWDGMRADICMCVCVCAMGFGCLHLLRWTAALRKDAPQTERLGSVVCGFCFASATAAYDIKDACVCVCVCWALSVSGNSSARRDRGSGGRSRVAAKRGKDQQHGHAAFACKPDV